MHYYSHIYKYMAGFVISVNGGGCYGIKQPRSRKSLCRRVDKQSISVARRTHTLTLQLYACTRAGVFKYYIYIYINIYYVFV